MEAPVETVNKRTEVAGSVFGEIECMISAPLRLVLRLPKTVLIQLNRFGLYSPPLAAGNIWMSEYIHKSHNVTVLLYHLVFPAKYRRVIFDEQVEAVLKDVCLGVAERYQVKFLEIGTDKDHVHFLVQSVPTYSVTKLVALIKSITAREIFRRCPQVKETLIKSQKLVKYPVDCNHCQGAH